MEMTDFARKRTDSAKSIGKLEVLCYNNVKSFTRTKSRNGVFV